jgi:hypothetical protein
LFEVFETWRWFERFNPAEVELFEAGKFCDGGGKGFDWVAAEIDLAEAG